MTLEAETTDLSGQFRIPHNTAAQVKGSIHDDATASKLGFKGGTVAGSLHMDQFVPLLTQIYGADWWAKGNMSMYFRQATVHGEAVKAFARPGSPHARLWMENEAGDLINEGTASCAGSDPDSELVHRLKGQATADSGALRILGKAKTGDEVKDVPLNVTREAVERRLETIPETMAEYREEKPILPPSLTVHLFRANQEKLFSLASAAVGLFGAIELQSVKGPLRAETPYTGRFKVLALSESPKTENIWYQAWAADPETGEDVAWMVMYLRFMKASSPLWS
ncbi:MAG: hypothetical protein ACHP7N_00915 [Caulobacterales bacterium]